MPNCTDIIKFVRELFFLNLKQTYDVLSKWIATHYQSTASCHLGSYLISNVQLDWTNFRIVQADLLEKFQYNSDHFSSPELDQSKVLNRCIGSLKHNNQCENSGNSTHFQANFAIDLNYAWYEGYTFIEVEENDEKLTVEELSRRSKIIAHELWIPQPVGVWVDTNIILVDRTNRRNWNVINA